MPTKVPSPYVQVDGAAIRELRKERGLNQPEMCALLGIHKGSLSHIERGSRPRVSPGLAKRIAKTLRVSRAAILASEQDEDVA